jgi:hypothetical protein
MDVSPCLAKSGKSKPPRGEVLSQSQSLSPLCEDINTLARLSTRITLVDLTLSRCRRLSKGVCAHRRVSNCILFYRGSVRSHSRAGIGLGTTI